MWDYCSSNFTCSTRECTACLPLFSAQVFSFSFGAMILLALLLLHFVHMSFVVGQVDKNAGPIWAMTMADLDLANTDNHEVCVG